MNNELAQKGHAQIKYTFKLIIGIGLVEKEVLFSSYQECHFDGIVSCYHMQYT